MYYLMFCYQTSISWQNEHFKLYQINFSSLIIQQVDHRFLGYETMSTLFAAMAALMSATSLVPCQIEGLIKMMLNKHLVYEMLSIPM